MCYVRPSRHRCRPSESRPLALPLTREEHSTRRDEEAEEQGLQYHCSDYFPLDALIDPAKKAEMLDSFKSTHNALINYKSAEAKQ